MPPLPAPDVLDRRRAGVLLHITSLPGKYGGDLGAEAYRFVDFLSTSGISVWQTLPLGPTHPDQSPYQCLSVHAGNPGLIDLQWLVDKSWLESTAGPEPGVSLAEFRENSLHGAAKLFFHAAQEVDRDQFNMFCEQQSNWLEDFCLYTAIRRTQKDLPWNRWPDELRDRQLVALRNTYIALEQEIEQVKFEQYVFFRQWEELKRYAHQHGVLLFGDMPIFVAYDSADVWANRENFLLSSDGEPTVVAGVPPDYFSETGQRWGNPHYDWKYMAEDKFSWWLQRLRTQLQLFDCVRIDHFRGLQAYWEIPATEETAINGRWVEAPGEALLDKIHKIFSVLPLVAEDLGYITPEVEALRDRFDLPGMKILQFAFDGSNTNAYLPHNHVANCVVYTGTHDNDTTLSWFDSLSDESKTYVMNYFGHPREAMPWILIRAALSSVARLSIIPMQDILALGNEHRMNTPGTMLGNWQWRFMWDQVEEEKVARLSQMIQLYDRRLD